MEVDLNCFSNGRWPPFFRQIEVDLNILSNGRRPQYFGKWKMTLLFWPIEDDINFIKRKRNSISFQLEDNLDCFWREDDLNFLLGKASLAQLSPSLFYHFCWLWGWQEKCWPSWMKLCTLCTHIQLVICTPLNIRLAQKS